MTLAGRIRENMCAKRLIPTYVHSQIFFDESGFKKNSPGILIQTLKQLWFVILLEETSLMNGC